MCYLTLLSTTSTRDLSAFDSPLMRCTRQLPPVAAARFLRHPNRWFLGTGEGCSCAFRHLAAEHAVLGFSPPQAWWPEDAAAVEATRQAFRMFQVLVGEGASLDAVDVWADDQGGSANLHGNAVVALDAVDEASFRFFEGHRLEFVREA